MVALKRSVVIVWLPSKGRAYYGMELNMEWKEKIGMEYGMAQVWNGMEDLMYGMEQIFHIPYKFYTCTF